MNDWLVMLFLGADDDLFPFGQGLLDEAVKVGSNECVAVVAELNPTTTNAQTLRGQLLPGRRDMKKIGITDGGTESIIDFVDDSKTRYEARNRALILWDHGNGWQNVHVFDHVADAIGVVRQHHQGHDPADGADGTAEPLFVNALRDVLDEKRGISIVGFDSCLMSMIEVAFQLRETAQFMVGSQHLVPAARGWPYEAILRALTLDPRMHPEAVVRTIVTAFGGSYNGSNDAVTLSGLRLSAEVDRAVAAIDSLSRELLTAIDKSDAAIANGVKGAVDMRSEIVYARRYTQSFGNRDYIDIISFCNQIQKRLLPTDRALNRAADLVKVAIARLVVRHTRSSAASVADANGISIYFPDPFEGAQVVESYEKLDFADTIYCRWLPFLKVIVEGRVVLQEDLATPSSGPPPSSRSMNNVHRMAPRAAVVGGAGHSHTHRQ
jgi:hypothetical protein